MARAYRLSCNDTKPLPFTCLPNGCSNSSETGAVDPRCLWLHRGAGAGLIVFGHLFKKIGLFSMVVEWSLVKALSNLFHHLTSLLLPCINACSNDWFLKNKGKKKPCIYQTGFPSVQCSPVHLAATLNVAFVTWNLVILISVLQCFIMLLFFFFFPPHKRTSAERWVNSLVVLWMVRKQDLNDQKKTVGLQQLQCASGLLCLVWFMWKRFNRVHR